MTRPSLAAARLYSGRCMRFGLFHRGLDLPTPGERMRRMHEEWLSRALRRPDGAPRIPVRRVDQGGFSALLAAPGGRERADQWWIEVFAAIDNPA